MNCTCACHDAGWVPHCPYCQDFGGPTHLIGGAYKLTPADLKKLNAEITMEDDPTTFSFTVRMVLTPPGPHFSAAQLGQLQYGCCVALSKELFAQDYLAAVEQSEMSLCAEMSAYFAKVGWPTWVLMVLGEEVAPEPMVASEYTLPQWGSKFSNVPEWGYGGDYVGGHTVVNDLTFLLPGLQEIVKCPATFPWCMECYAKKPEGVSLPPCDHGGGVRCNESYSVQKMIVHLNDRHRWDRETQVADWLESLDVDLSFPSEEEIEQRKAERAKKVDSIVAQNVLAPPSTIGKIMADIYAQQIAYQEQAVALTASWFEKEPHTPWQKKSVTFDVHNKMAAQEVAEKMDTGNHVKWIDALHLEASQMFKVPVHFSSEWVDKKTEAVDPLEFKKNAAKHHQKFLHNPTKSKPPKKK